MYSTYVSYRGCATQPKTRCITNQMLITDSEKRKMLGKAKGLSKRRFTLPERCGSPLTFFLGEGMRLPFCNAPP